MKLLRFLETKAIDRVGGSKTIELDVRLVTATNRNLEQLVREGKFREDLYFRLDVVRFVMPPLRQRTGGHPRADRALHQALLRGERRPAARDRARAR